MDTDPETFEMRPEIGDEPSRRPLHPTNYSDSSKSSNSRSGIKNILKVGGVALTAITLIYTSISATFLLARSSESAADESSQFTSAYVRWGIAGCGVDQTPDAEGYAAASFNADGTIAGGEVLCMQENANEGENLTVESDSIKMKMAPVNLLNLSKDTSRQNQTGVLKCAVCQTTYPYTVTLFGKKNCDHSDLGYLYSGYVVGFPGASPICVDEDSKTSESEPLRQAEEKLIPAEQDDHRKSVPCAVCYGIWV